MCRTSAAISLLSQDTRCVAPWEPACSGCGRKFSTRWLRISRAATWLTNVEMETGPARFAEGSLKFEAGTPNVAGAIGLATAIEFLESLGRKALWMREQELTRYA